MKIILVIFTILFISGCSVKYGTKIVNSNTKSCKSDLARATYTMLIEADENEKLSSAISQYVAEKVYLIKNHGHVLTVSVNPWNKFIFSTRKYEEGCKLLYIGYTKDNFSYMNTLTYINEKPIYSCYCAEME